MSRLSLSLLLPFFLFLSFCLLDYFRYLRSFPPPVPVSTDHSSYELCRAILSYTREDPSAL